jgi:two-component system phosphate regulon sensor histidine kinase PhoR
MQIQTSRMTDIVNELLQLSRLESRGLADKTNELDICGMLNAAKNTLPQALELPELNIECQSTARLMGEITEIESVILNLLNNAIRHTPRDKRIALGWRDTAKGAELYVSDTGEGVAREYLPRLTERFFRVDQGRGRATGGTGLGLAIVKHVVGRHEGDLEFESEPGQGLTVTCRFPASRISRQA